MMTQGAKRSTIAQRMRTNLLDKRSVFYVETFKIKTMYDNSSIEKVFQSDLQKGINVARSNNMNLTKFKKEIKQGLLTINDEDQWTFDYESYLCSIGDCYTSPSIWGEEYYYGRWKAK